MIRATGGASLCPAHCVFLRVTQQGAGRGPQATGGSRRHPGRRESHVPSATETANRWQSGNARGLGWGNEGATRSVRTLRAGKRRDGRRRWERLPAAARASTAP